MPDTTAKPVYPANKYLEGPYEPVHAERVVEHEEIEIVGEVPNDLDGVYVRNGPNVAHPPIGNYHRYDGDGMLHAIRFKDGQAEYRNRWIETEAYLEEAAAGQALWGGMLDPRRADRPDMPLKDTANTDVVLHDGKLVAMWYLSGQPYWVDPVTLETLGPADLKTGRPERISAHSKTDESNGDFVFFSYGRDAPYMQHGVLDANGALTAFTPIELPGPRLPHDMWVSHKHTILHDLPLVYDDAAYAQGRVKLAFREEWPTRFGVLPRHGENADIRWYEFEPCYLLHTINAWEDGDWLHLTGCRIHPFEDGQGNPDLQSIITIMGRHKLNARLYKWSINLKTGATKEGLLDDQWNAEFPTWRNDAMGGAMRFAYCAEIKTDPVIHFPGLLKYDMTTGAAERHSGGPGIFYSEAPFAPAVGGTAEEDGYLISLVRNETDGRSEVHVIDARNFAAEPVCKLLLPCRVPDGFHATWARGDLI